MQCRSSPQGPPSCCLDPTISASPSEAACGGQDIQDPCGINLRSAPPHAPSQRPTGSTKRHTYSVIACIGHRLRVCGSHQDPNDSKSSSLGNRHHRCLHNPPQPSTTLHNPPQPSTTLHNPPQPFTTLHNPPQPSTTLHNPPQPSTTLHNPSQPFTTLHNLCNPQPPP